MISTITFYCTQWFLPILTFYYTQWLLTKITFYYRLHSGTCNAFTVWQTAGHWNGKREFRETGMEAESTKEVTYFEAGKKEVLD